MRRAHRSFLLAAFAVTLLLTGCGTPFCESTGDKKLAPVLTAIAEFQKANNGRIPESLEELQKAQPSAEPFELHHSTDHGLVWSIEYTLRSPTSYLLEFAHVHCDVRYVDGKKVHSSSSPFR